MWTSNASVADIVTVVARTAENEFSMFLVDREEHGFEVREIEKLGLNGWPLCQVVFSDVVVPEENLLGGIGGGLREAMKGFERSRCFVSTLALGISHSALQEAIEYAKQRTQFGKPIAGHPVSYTHLLRGKSPRAGKRVSAPSRGLAGGCRRHRALAD